jgi:CubicO group peptidase (beta-lactamase class C family)
MSNLGIPTDQYSWTANRYRDTEIGGVASREFGSGIETNVDALARIGHLYLRNGEWNGTEILPTSYVTAAGAPVAGIQGLPSLDSLQFSYATRHYGLLWWNNADGVMSAVPTDAYFAWGYSEEFIIVLPSHDIVVARLGEPWRVDTKDPVFPVLEPFLRSVVESVLLP